MEEYEALVWTEEYLRNNDLYFTINGAGLAE